MKINGVEISETVTFISDPGHGWLVVPLRELAALEIENKISRYSFYDSQYVYLEEDCDAGVYADRIDELGLTRPSVKEEYTEYFSREQSRITELPATYWESLRNE